jgi:hypothetical protein
MYSIEMIEYRGIEYEREIMYTRGPPLSIYTKSSLFMSDSDHMVLSDVVPTLIPDVDPHSMMCDSPLFPVRKRRRRHRRKRDRVLKERTGRHQDIEKRTDKSQLDRRNICHTNKSSTVLDVIARAGNEDWMKLFSQFGDAPVFPMSLTPISNPYLIEFVRQVQRLVLLVLNNEIPRSDTILSNELCIR